MPKQGSKSGKSSKTARVLNLLTDPDSIEESAEETEASPSAPKLPDDRKTQARIRGALEQELAAEAPMPPAKPRPAPPKSAGALRTAAPAAEEPEAPAEHPAAPARRPIPPKPATIRPVSFPTIEADEEPEAAAPAKPVAPRAPAAPKPVAPTPAPAPAPDPAPAPAFTVPAPRAPLQAAMAELHTAMEKDPDEYICYNVTQALVEDKADKYIRMFGLCSCNRCRIDVIALALSNLPAKYVVAKPDELIPRLSMYEQKYNAAVVTQVMSACKKVLDRPHHVREQN